MVTISSGLASESIASASSSTEHPRHDPRHSSRANQVAPPSVASFAQQPFAQQPFVGAPRGGDQSSGYALSHQGGSRWSTLRFRRAKDQKSWALLGIPLSLYPLVVQRLFEEQAQFISKYRLGGFVNLRFEAPQTLAATLAMTFPTPPGCEPLRVNQKGDRILGSDSPHTDQVRVQTIAPI